jgi:hypothetical protein
LFVSISEGSNPGPFDYLCRVITTEVIILVLMTIIWIMVMETSNLTSWYKSLLVSIYGSYTWYISPHSQNFSLLENITHMPPSYSAYISITVAYCVCVQKVKLSCYTPWRHTYSFFMLALDGDEWSALRLSCALTWGKDPWYPLDIVCVRVLVLLLNF